VIMKLRGWDAGSELTFQPSLDRDKKSQGASAMSEHIFRQMRGTYNSLIMGS